MDITPVFAQDPKKDGFVLYNPPLVFGPIRENIVKLFMDNPSNWLKVA